MSEIVGVDGRTDAEMTALGYRRIPDSDGTGDGIMFKDCWIRDESPVDEKRCRDCGVLPGMQHDQGCDVARCISTGEQWIQCPGEEHEYHGRVYGEHEGLCLPEIWTGTWPGEAEAIEFGWYSYFDHGWVRSGADHPGASPDLNRLHMGECEWSAEHCRWMLKNPVVN